MKIAHGVQLSVLRRNETVAGSADVTFDVQSDSLLTTLFAEVNTGTLSVQVYAITQGGPADDAPAQEMQLYAFPTLNAPTPNLLVQPVLSTTSRVRVKATWTGACTFDVQARAVNGGGGSGGGGGGATSVSEPTLASATIVVANVEQSYALPAGTQWFSIINQSVPELKVAYTVGQSATNYRVVPSGCSTTHPVLDPTASITIYFQAATTGGRIEFESWE